MNPHPFSLDPRLASDTRPVAELPLSLVLLMRDARYPWAILVPKKTGLVELTDLPRDDRIQLMDEIAAVSEALATETSCLKLNVAAIGNVVRQLHVHVVARFEGDAAWPGPVWGRHPAVPYAPDAEADLVKGLASRLLR